VSVDEHMITIGQTPVFYRRASLSGVPPLYLHGIPTSADDWSGFLERTGGIAPDLPGFGRTGKGGNLDYSLEGHADFLERFLAELDVHEVKMVVHDWGAGGGLVFAQRHPERVTRLVLLNALPLLEGFHWHRLARVLRRPLVGELVMGSTTRQLLTRTLRRGCVKPQAFSQEALATVWDQFDQGTQRATLRLHRSADEQRLAAAGTGLSSLKAPALVLWGENDPWFHPSCGEAYAARLPQAELQRTPGAGHWPWLDVPTVLDRVAAFLKATG
jgi:pimeloyl-ACP methyl ester carboxylesterase